MEGVRLAQPSDMARCVSLLEAALDAAKRLRGGPDLLDGRGGTSSPVGDWTAPGSDRVLLAGLFDGQVVGVAAGHTEPDRGGLLGVVDCCYVEPPARQVGVGGALAGSLMEWFTDRGCAGVDALALPGDRSSKQLLESCGFKTRLLVLRRRLP